MGIICSSKRRIKFKHSLLSPEERYKIENSLPRAYRQIIKQKYEEFGQTIGLTFEEFCQIIPLNQQGYFLKRIFNFFDQQKRNRINLEEMYLVVSKMYNPLTQVEILFEIYDLDNDRQWSKKEFNKFIRENLNLLKAQSQQQIQPLNQNQFYEWAQEHLNLVDLQNGLKCLFVSNNKKEIAREILQKVDEIISQDQSVKMFIISAKWLNKLKCYVGLNQEQPQQNLEELSESQNEPGKIDNSDISGENEGELRQGLKDEDYNIVPHKVWQNLIDLFSITDQKLIYKRSFENIHNKLDSELYPKIMLGIQVEEVNNNLKLENLYDKSQMLKMNTDSTMHDIRKKLFKRFNIQTSNGKEFLLYYRTSKDQIWKLVTDLDDAIQNLPSRTLFTMTKLKMSPPINQTNLQLTQNSLQNVGDVQKKDIIYTGIQNEGQICYMNAVLQCLAETPFLSNFLYNSNLQKIITQKNQLVKQKNCQPPKITLIEELSRLVKKLQDGEQQHISIESFIEAVTQNILDSRKQPIYPLYETADSNEFLKDLLEHISSELKRSEKEKNTIIDTLFQGIKKTKTFCQQCGYVKEEEEKINILNLNVLEMKDECRLQLMFFQKYKLYETKDQSKEIELKKKRITLKSNQTIKQLQEEISKITNLNKNEYEIAFKKQGSKGALFTISENHYQSEIYKLGITSKKTIYVYELGNQDQAKREFIEISQIFNYPTSNFQLNDIVNFKSKDNLWKEGYIVDILENQYEILDISQNQKYRINNQDISQFRKNVQYQQNTMKIEVYNYFNQSKYYQIKQILQPMIIQIPIKSITFQELKVYIYKQIQRFINIDEFKVKPKFNSTKGQEEEVKKFFNQPEFPYRIQLVDKDNKCLNCKKPLTFVDKIQTNCKCEVDPILLKFDNANKPKVILVWNQTQKYLKQLKIKSDYDFKLEDYLKQYTNIYELKKNCGNCKIPLFDLTFLFVAPIILVIFLPKLTNTVVHFEIKSQNIKDCRNGIEDVLYNLYAVINLKQQNDHRKQTILRHYNAFVKKQDEWIEFNDSQIKKIDLHKITSKNACLLFYIKQDIKDDIKFQIQDFF
ncbi:unnamed protein product [Paramecium sonneborni]|uniref:ubiquitinyl hydrolase 1 n=1 Tax=Paramecium sonneborni TaxID=65129 RepID=A0A8S1R4I0_9CILI|nr:unnamed protein product [Paramecium sonneborni]